MKSRDFKVARKTECDSSASINKRGSKVENTVVKQLNPIGSNCCPLKCHSFTSVRHMVQDCPDSYENIERIHESTAEDIEVCWLFTGSRTELIQDLAGESLNSSVLDSACSSTASGEEWLKCYIDKLRSESLAQVIRKKSHTVF